MNPYRTHVEAAAEDHKLDPDLVEAICWQESGHQTDAFRHEPDFWHRYLKDRPEHKYDIPRRVSSSYGLMQVMYTTAVQFGFDDDPEYLFLPEVSLAYGCRYLAFLLKWAKGDVKQALAAYNGGQGAWKNPRPQLYAQRVFAYYQKLKAAKSQK